MFREQMINFLQAAVVLLLMTNVIRVLATTYAVRLVRIAAPARSDPGNAAERRLDAVLRRVA